jgi:TRAP-type C4-dicarboxylate transport system permease small subunit
VPFCALLPESPHEPEVRPDGEYGSAWREGNPMTVKQRYAQAMEWLYLFCVAISGTALIVITLIIPLGVFMRYVMNAPLSWPEPAAVVMMVMFSFLGGAAVYRANVHVAVEALLNAVGPRARRWMLWAVDVCMAATALFMIGYGIQLCVITQFQSMAEFPWLSVAIVYLPIPVSGVFTLLFLIERVWVGSPPKTSIMYRDQATELE